MSFSKLYNCYYAVLVILTALICTYYQELFIYQRQALEQGELWRLFSGHFVHLNNKHLVINLIAWIIIFFLGISYLSPTKWVILLFVLTLSISAGLYLFIPEVVYYGGLSGVLHGYFAYILIAWIKDRQKFAWIILLLLIVKIFVENFSDRGSSTAEYLNIQVVSEVHLIGAFVGVLGALIIFHRAMIYQSIIRTLSSLRLNA